MLSRVEFQVFLMNRLEIAKLPFERYWNNHHLLKHYLQIFLMVEQLADEGKIIIDEDKNISLAKVTFLDYDEIKEVTIWDLEHKKEDIKKKKEIIERYQTINFFA